MKNIATILLCALSLQGCTMAKFSGKSGVPVLLNQPNEKVVFMEHVRVKKHRLFDYTAHYDMSSILNKRITKSKPDMVTNATLTVKFNPANFLLNYVTLGFARSRMVIIDADFVKLPN